MARYLVDLSVVEALRGAGLLALDALARDRVLLLAILAQAQVAHAVGLDAATSRK